MASNIVPGNIDGTYPVAGQDNSSQGFRDNFNAIKNNFTEAKTEIEALQSNKANLDGANDFSGNSITDAEFKDNSETVFAHGSIDGTITLNHENGHYQTLTTTGTITLGFLNMPATNKLGRIILDVTVASTAHTITIPSSVLVAGNVSGGDGSSDTITVPTSGRYLYEFMSPDGGTTILMHQLGNNYI
jgi:paraquat-inducible protein B